MHTLYKFKCIQSMHSAAISVIDVLISEPRVQTRDPLLSTSETRRID